MCVACPAGTTNAAGDDASGGNTTCDATLCGSNQRVQNNLCVPCPAGTRNAADDDASGPDTTCDPVLCGADERVVLNTCVACPPGTENDADDDASGADTMCDPIICSVDEFVSSNMCTMCPVDLFNHAGDDASGADTMCFDICTRDIGVSCPDFGPVNLTSTYPNANFLYQYGEKVALDGDTLVVGVEDDDNSFSGVNPSGFNDSLNNSGAIFIYERIGGAWVEQAYIKEPVPAASAAFGKHVAVHGDTAMAASVGLTNDTTHVYVRQNGMWSREATLVPDPATCPDTVCRFGESVALLQDMAFVTSLSATSEIQLHIFTRSNGLWSESQILTLSNSASGAAFSHNLRAKGDTVLLGVPNESSVPGMPMDTSLNASGAVYVFTNTGGLWSETQLLKASNAESGDLFGIDVDVDQNIMVVGAISEDSGSRVIGVGEDRNDSSLAGAAYVFEKVGQTWTQTAYIKPSNTNSRDEFGTAVGISGNRMVITAEYEKGEDTGLNGDEHNDNTSGIPRGAAYLFEKDSVSGDWQQLGYIKPPANVSNPQNYGADVSVSGDTAVVGMRFGSQNGNAFVYQIR